MTECLSLPFVASFEDWFYLFRTWSFTLCKKDLDSNDISVRVLCGYNRSPCCIYKQFIRFPLLRRPSFITVPFLSSFMRTRIQRVPFLMLLSLRAQRKLASILLWLSLHLIFCVVFDITSEQSVELKWLMFNKHKRWFHSSLVKFVLVRMSASWFLVSMYLIWILESKLILSSDQSRATLWVLETCLIVGLLPLMIILITPSLSSNTYNKASWCEDWMFEGTQSMLFKTLNILGDCLR